MKKSIILLGICATLLAACSSNDSKSGQDTTHAMSQTNNDNQTTIDTMGANAGSAPTTDVNSKGKAMIQKMDCIGCHKEHDKLVGPAYADIAKKYEANDENIEKLADKIIAGGKGVWGEVPMTPHPNLSKDDAKELVKYILTVK